MYLNHVVSAYNATTKFPTKGYPESTIRTVESQLGIHFPAAYREFLATLASEFDPWAGSDFSPGLLPKLQEWAQDILADGDHQPPWPADALVFEQNGGNEFNFFRLSEGDDPPVYYYYMTQEDAAFQQTAPAFSAFVAASLAWSLELQNIPVPPVLRPAAS
jgi:hypothetical protein